MKTKRLSLQQLPDSEVTVEVDGAKLAFTVGDIQGDKEVVTLSNEEKTCGIRFYYLDLDRLVKGEETLAPVTMFCKAKNAKTKTP